MEARRPKKNNTVNGGGGGVCMLGSRGAGGNRGCKVVLLLVVYGTHFIISGNYVLREKDVCNSYFNIGIHK